MGGQLVISAKACPVVTHGRQYNVLKTLIEVIILTNIHPPALMVKIWRYGLQCVHLDIMHWEWNETNSREGLPKTLLCIQKYTIIEITHHVQCHQPAFICLKAV